MRRAILLAVICFALVLIARFPARWLNPFLPKSVHCQQLDGTAWRGSCTGLVSSNAPIGDLGWDLQLLQLLRAQLAVRIDLTNQGSFVRGELARGFGAAVHGRDLSVDLPLNSNLIASFPAGVRARLTGRLAQVEWTGRYLSALRGELSVQDLFTAQGEALGSYQAEFAGDGGDTPTGTVHDTGGPLQLTATVQLTHEPGYALQGKIMARPEASSGLSDMIKYLGSPDATGARQISLQGTF